MRLLFTYLVVRRRKSYTLAAGLPNHLSKRRAAKAKKKTYVNKIY